VVSVRLTVIVLGRADTYIQFPSSSRNLNPAIGWRKSNVTVPRSVCPVLWPKPLASVLFRNPFTVDHVTEVIFVFLLVSVLLDEIFLIRKLQDDGKRTE
jgi:hypothetical protein